MSNLNLTAHSVDDLNVNRGPAVLIEVWCLIFLTTLVVALRIHLRKVSLAPLWWDDWSAVVGLVLCWIHVILINIDILRDGLGQHTLVVGEAAEVRSVQDFFALELVYFLVITTAKLSLLLFLWRIFNASSMIWLVYIMSGVVSLWCLGTILRTFLQCRPIDALWYPSKGHCMSIRNIFLSIAIPNVVTDCLLMVIPIPLIWPLHMTKNQKLRLSFAFALGGLVTVISMVRLTLAIANFGPQNDLTWDVVTVGQWSIAELYIAVIAACFPALAPLARPIRDICKGRKPSWPSRPAAETQIEICDPCEGSDAWWGSAEETKTFSIIEMLPAAAPRAAPLRALPV